MRYRDSSANDSPLNSFATTPAILIFITLECLVAIQALLAYRDQFFTVFQMRQRGIEQGLPFVWHFGMWGDFFLVSGLAAYVTGQCFSHWHGRQILISIALAFSTAAIMSWTYTLSNIAEAHVQNHHLTVVGVVHLFYMGIALAVFILFLFFSKDVSTRLLRAVSALLFVQVFLGTHMALGIVNAFAPLDWYPAEPLKSAIGWTTLAIVGIVLVWRNSGSPAIAGSLAGAARRVGYGAKWLFEIYLFFRGERTTSAEQYLYFLHDVCAVLSLSFLGLFLSKWQHSEFFASFLVLLFGLIYTFSRVSVKTELRIAKSLFPAEPGRIPDDLKLKDRGLITLSVFGFLGLYMALAYFAEYILVASFCMFVIACIDFNTRRVIGKRFRRYFADARYAPFPYERDYKAIQDRRSVVAWFLFDLPNFRKEGARVAGCAIALGIAAYGHVNGLHWFDLLAYAVLIGTLTLNEVVTHRWRWDRYVRLKAIDEEAKAASTETRDGLSV